MDASDLKSPWTVPTGTQVVTKVEVRNVAGKVAHPRGAVGVMVEGPTADSKAYRVRFPDAFETLLARDDLELLKHFKQGELAAGQAVEVA